MAQKPRPLTARHRLFVAEYVCSLNATQAAIKAGYSVRTADVQGPRLLGNVGVSAAIRDALAKHVEKAELTADRTLEELRRIAFFDIRQLFDEAGNLRPVDELPADVAAAVSSIEVVVKNAKAGDGRQDIIHKVRTSDKIKALETLAKHFKFLPDRVEHSGTLTRVDETEPDEALIARLETLLAKAKAQNIHCVPRGAVQTLVGSREKLSVLPGM